MKKHEVSPTPGEIYLHGENMPYLVLGVIGEKESMRVHAIGLQYVPHRNEVIPLIKFGWHALNKMGHELVENDKLLGKIHVGEDIIDQMEAYETVLEQMTKRVGGNPDDPLLIEVDYKTLENLRDKMYDEFKVLANNAAKEIGWNGKRCELAEA